MARSRSATEASMRNRRAAAAMVTPSLGTARLSARADKPEHKPAVVWAGTEHPPAIVLS
jgi:hypothetical protein